jgi:type I restriction enzyme S subunit
VRHKAYHDNRDAEAEWLGRVPKHWEVKRLKYSASINDEALPETTSPDFEFSYVDIGNVDSVEGIKEKEQLVFETAPSRARRMVRDGDTIVSTVRTYLRAIAPIKKASENLIVSTGFAVVRPREVRSDFLSYALRESSFVETVVARSVGVSYPAINASEVGTIPIPVPPPGEQRAIADFLDRETARLDTLVGKKWELIEKLREKRTALISRTVTHGLNPNVKLKPSGIEWLGDIPEHWEVKPFRHAMKGGTRNGLYKSSEYSDPDGTPIIQMGEAFASPIIQKTADDRLRLTAQEKETWGLQKNDLLFARRSLVFEGSGKCSMVGNLPEPHIFESSLIRVRPRPDRLDARFLFWFIRSAFSRAQILAITKQVTISGLDTQQLKAIAIVTPPRVEQTAIADYLEGETAKLDRMMEKVGAAIEKLQEYRTALITAAVTGKIDVRNSASAADPPHHTH